MTGERLRCVNAVLCGVCFAAYYMYTSTYRMDGVFTVDWFCGVQFYYSKFFLQITTHSVNHFDL